MGFIDATLRGVLNLATNVGKAAYDVASYSLLYAFDRGSLKAWKPVAKEGLGKRLTSLLGWAGRTGVRTAISGSEKLGRAVVGAISTGASSAPAIMGKTAGFATDVARVVGVKTLGTANILGRATSFMFKDELDEAGNIVRDINNLWTGKKMKRWAGLSLLGAGAAYGIYRGIKETGGGEGYVGNTRQEDLPTQTYDGLAASATGDLVLALHNLRRG